MLVGPDRSDREPVLVRFVSMAPASENGNKKMLPGVNLIHSAFSLCQVRMSDPRIKSARYCKETWTLDAGEGELELWSLV